MNERRRCARGEEGSVILSVLVVIVGSMAVLALLSSVGSGLTQVRRDQSRANAFQYSNAGMDAALFRVDTKTLPATPSSTATGSYTPVLDGTEVIGFTEVLDLDGVTYELDVLQDPPGQDASWKVRSVGTDPTGQQRQAIADIEAARLFENGFFTLNEFIITGTQFRNIPVAYDSSTCPLGLTSCELPLPVDGRLGTNDLFEGSNATLVSLIEQWSGFNMYGRTTIEAAQAHCFDGDCHTTMGQDPAVLGQVFNVAVPLPVERPPVPAGAQVCPTTNGTLGAPNTTVTVAPGDYLCDDLNLAGTINVSGTGDARFWIDGSLSAAGGAVVNRQQRPKRFQLFQQRPPGDVSYDGEICGAEIWGLLYTPGLEIKCNGSHQPTIFGTVVANLHDGAGNHFKFHWDVSTRDTVHTGKYNVRNWRECPVGTTDC